MAEPSVSEVLAAWLIFAQRSGTDGRLMPTDAEVKAIIARPPERWDEACALAEALCQRIMAKTPKTLIGATKDFAKEVHSVSQKLGDFLSTPAVERTK